MAKRGDRAWKVLAKQVINEEPLCYLRLMGCSVVSTTADHVIPVKARPDLTMERANLRGACAHCNNVKGARPLDAVLRETTVITDSPALAFFG